MDVNGDGRNDVIIGVAGYDYPGEELDIEDAGSFMVYFGRPAASDGTTQVLCEPNLVYVNKTEVIETRLGSAAAIVGSIDGDSCDEVLVGADGDFDLEVREGLVWVVRGWGGLDCPSAPEVAVLASHIRRAHLGSVLYAGGDYDGDGLNDVVVGNPDFVTEGLPSGGLWLVPGVHLASLPTEPLGLERPQTFHPLVMPGASPLLLRAIGTTGDGQFGRDVAAVPHADGGARDALLVGIPFGKAGGSLQSGGALVLEVKGVFGDDDYGFDPVPVALFGGESSRSGSQFGAAVGGGLLDGQPWVVIGGPEASAVTMDNGAIASFPLVR